MTLFLLIVAVGFVAFTNGANANFKGVASLYGSGTCSMRTALIWGTATTFAGSIAAVFLAQGLLLKFSGKGLVSDTLLQSASFVIAVAAGAAVTSFLANRLGFPVSTTHALVGGLVGAGWIGSNGTVQLSALGRNFVYPLLFSPVLAIVLGAFSTGLLTRIKLERLNARVLNALHFLSAGSASFARGLNDTPKIAAMLLFVPQLGTSMSLILVGITIGVGALVDSRHVAETLGRKVSGMTPATGFASNVVTCILVTTASLHSMPVSTTHVSVGSLIGMGVVSREAKWQSIVQIMLAWVATVPCAGIVACTGYCLLRWFE